MTHRITLVDDDRNILTSVSMVLESEGYQIKSFNDGEAGLAGILEDIPDLCILDIKMPRMDGTELLQNLRQHSQVPVIFLTSKDDELDEAIGLRLGADDYITKPFSQRLLLERIRALLRRQDLMKEAEAAAVSAPAQSANEDEKIMHGPLMLDNARHLCTWNSKPLNFTVTEYLLIKALAIQPGHVRSRDHLIEAAYGDGVYVDDRTIDSHIKRIRKKFKQIDDSFDKIETLYGVGYRYSED